MALTLALSIGLDAELLSTRNSILQSAGYFVVPAYSFKEAAKYFQGGDFDLVLLCQSIPRPEQDRLISWIRARGSLIPVLSVSAEPRSEDRFARETVASDPTGLLTGIREVLINSGPQPVWTPASQHNKNVRGVSLSKEVAAA